MPAHLFIPPISYLGKSLQKFIASVHLLYKRLRILRCTIERTCIRQYNVLGKYVNCRQTNRHTDRQRDKQSDGRTGKCSETLDFP